MESFKNAKSSAPFNTISCICVTEAGQARHLLCVLVLSTVEALLQQFERIQHIARI